MDILYNVARSWIGVPFRWRGYTRFGCDCAGFIIGLIKELIDLGELVVSGEIINEYTTLKYYKNVIKQQNMQIQEIMERYFLPYDVKKENILIVKGRTKHFPLHFGIYNSVNNTFLHAIPTRGVVEVNFNDNMFDGFVDFFVLKEKKPKCVAFNF